MYGSRLCPTHEHTNHATFVAWGNAPPLPASSAGVGASGIVCLARVYWMRRLQTYHYISLAVDGTSFILSAAHSLRQHQPSPD